MGHDLPGQHFHFGKQAADASRQAFLPDWLRNGAGDLVSDVLDLRCRHLEHVDCLAQPIAGSDGAFASPP